MLIVLDLKPELHACLGGTESIYVARYAGLGLCLNLHPQLALWATGIIASFAGSAVCRIVETPGALLEAMPLQRLFLKHALKS
jgi:hypothetical protein